MILLAIVYFLTAIFPVSTFALTNDSQIDNLLTEIEKKLLLGEREEGPGVSKYYKEATAYYNAHPIITDDMVKDAVSGYMSNLQDRILDLGELSPVERGQVVDMLENWNFSCKFVRNYNGEVMVMTSPDIDFHPITKAREDAAIAATENEYFKDKITTPSAWAKEGVAAAIKLGLVPTNLQNKYQDAITREEFASLFVTTAFAFQKNMFPAEDVKWYGTHAITKQELLNGVKVLDFNFTDTNNEDVKVAYIMGLVNGTSKTTFTPTAKITRQEAAVMLTNYAQISTYPTYAISSKQILDLNKCASWAKDSIITTYYSQFFNGTSGVFGEKVTMSPLENFTREQAIIVALRVYNMDLFQAIKIRGQVSYNITALKLDWEVTRDSITAVRFKPGMTLNASEDDFVELWRHYSPAKDLGEIKSEYMIAASPEAGWLYFGVFPDSLIITTAKGENATFDLGYAEYEVNNANFIFQYRFKNNGVHNHQTYGGSALQPIKFTRLK